MSDVRYNQNVIGIGSVIVEIGAHRGRQTKELYEKHGCRIIAIEPSITSFEKLIDIKKACDARIDLLWAAINGQEGTKRFYEYEHDAGYEGEADSLYGLDKKILHEYDVPIINMRTIFKKYNLPKIDLLLLDCEGSEIAILNEIIIHKLPVWQICVEYHPQIYGERIMQFMKRYMQIEFKVIFDDKYKNVTYEKRGC